MFKKWFSKEEPVKSQVPEIMGLRLGGAFELDALKLRLIEPNIFAEGIAKTQLIQAVGVVRLDESSTVLRYYTDDDAFLQVVLSGGMTENHIEDVKLWHFYDTKAVDTESAWNNLIDHQISQMRYVLEESYFEPVWKSMEGIGRPVAMTERTYTEETVWSETDQFAMLYERSIDGEDYEFLMAVGEEKLEGQHFDRCFVLSTGINLQPADITIIG